MSTKGVNSTLDLSYEDRMLLKHGSDDEVRMVLGKYLSSQKAIDDLMERRPKPYAPLHIKVMMMSTMPAVMNPRLDPNFEEPNQDLQFDFDRPCPLR